MKKLLPAIVPLLLLSLWELSAWFNWIDSRFFPPPTKIAVQVWHMITTPDLLKPLLSNLGITARRIAIGFVIGGAAGIIVGWAMGLSRTIRDALGSVIYGTYPTPKIAIFPLLIVLLGIGEWSKIAMIALGAFYMVCINTVNGITYSSSIYADIAKAFNIPWTIRQLRITLPAALPSIATGLKLGFGQALILVISVEFVGSSNGLGYYIWNSWQVLDISAMFVGLAIVAFIGGMIVVVGNYLERKLMPWSG